MSPRNARLAAAYASIAGCAAAFLWYTGGIGGNVRVVEPGRVYRSAQIKGGNLTRVLAARRIRTVINLRGGSSVDPWYDSEVASCRHYGAAHIDIPMSAHELPDPRQLQKLLDAFDHSTYPLLVHCQGGSDRSGLAATLYLAIYQHVPLDTAQSRELTWRYGHLKWGPAHPMDDFFTLYRQTGHGMPLREWIERVYPRVFAGESRR